MAKDPAVLFYTSDFLSGTLTMSNEDIGKYIKLLCLQHQKGRLSQSDLNYICSTYVSKDILDKFKKDEKGYFYNERMEAEALKRKSYSESRRKNINKRYGNKSNSTYVVHMENENEDINIDFRKEGLGEKPLSSFENFWKLYPRKQAKQTALKSWERINPDQPLIKKILDAVRIQSKTDQWTKDKGQFIPLPATWLNQNRWEDEVLEKVEKKEYKPQFGDLKTYV